MRPVICAFLAIAASTSTARAAAEVTLILQFDGRHSEPSVNEMKRELQNLMRGSGVELRWRNYSELSASESFPNIVVVKFHGSCETRAFGVRPPDDGTPLGYSHVSNGEILPFADLECDSIRGELRTADDRTLGRAMGRVLAHELHHIIDRTRSHSRTGILRKSLSPQDLMADRTLSLSFSR